MNYSLTDEDIEKLKQIAQKLQEENYVPTVEGFESFENKQVILYCSALKFLVIDKFAFLNDDDITRFMKIYKRPHKTQYKNKLTSERFNKIYMTTISKNIQQSGIDSVYPIPDFSGVEELTFDKIINISYKTYCESLMVYKIQIMKISYDFYNKEKKVEVQKEYEHVIEFLKYYSQHRDMFNDENVEKSIQEWNDKFGQSFINNINPIIHIFGSYFEYFTYDNIMLNPKIKMGEVIKKWLDIKYDDRTDKIRVNSLFIKMFYKAMQVKKGNIYAEDYAKNLRDIEEKERQLKEDIRQKLLKESEEIKEERRKSDMKLKARKLIKNKKNTEIIISEISE